MTVKAKENTIHAVHAFNEMLLPYYTPFRINDTLSGSIVSPAREQNARSAWARILCHISTATMRTARQVMRRPFCELAL